MLKNPLENFPTTWRILRHLEKEFSDRDLQIISLSIKKAFSELLDKPEGYPQLKYQMESLGRYKVLVYPASFIPEMIKITEDYFISKTQEKVIKPKRKRIKYG